MHSKFIVKHPNNFPNVHENFKTLNINKFVGEVKSDWCEEMIMQFIPQCTSPDGRIKWMTEGGRFESAFDEWAKLLGLPPR